MNTIRFAYRLRHGVLRHLPRYLLTLLLGISLGWSQPASAAIVYVAASSGRNDALPTDGTAGALTIPKPAGTSAGMALIASIAARPRSMTVTVPTGWVQMTFTNQTLGGSSTAPGGMTLVTYYKVATTSEPNSYTWTFANPSNDGGSAVGGILAFNGVDTSSGNPIDVWNAQASAGTGSNTITAPSITTTGVGEMVVASISYLSAGNFSGATNAGSPVLAFTERLDQSAPVAANAVGTTLQMSTATKATAGATGTTSATFNGSADAGVGHQMALRVTQIDPSLAMTRSAPLNPGGTSSYVLTVTNLGVVAEPGPITIVNTLPPSVSLSSYSGSGWTCNPPVGQVVTCTNVTSIPAGGSIPNLTLSVAISAAATGVLTNTATVSGTGGDGNTANNTATNTYIIPTQPYVYLSLDDPSGSSTFADSSGNGRNASKIGSAAATGPTVPSPFGSALTGNPGTCGATSIPATTGNGINTNVNINTLGSAAGTIMLWYASNTVWNDGTSRLLFDASNDLGNAAADRHFYLAKDGAGRLVFSVKNNTGTTITATTAAGYGFAAATWHHIAVSWSTTAPNNQLAIYLDGDPTPVATATLSNGLGTLSTLYIGARRMTGVTGTPASYTSNDANGYVDEVRLYTNRLDPLEIAQLADQVHACQAIDHYELALNTNSISCLGSTVTVTACADSTSPCATPSGTVSGSTATLSTSAGTLGASSVVFGVNGTASTTLSYAGAANLSPATVTLSGESIAATSARKCCANGTSCSVANSCTTTFGTAGFAFSSTSGGTVGTLPSQIAGTSSGNLYLRAVKTNTSTQACEAALVGANTVDLGYECNNPSTCSGSNLMAINGGTSTVIQRNNNGASISYTAAVPMTFDANGNAPFTQNFTDVGLVTLWARKAASGSLLTSLTGASNAYVVKPADLRLTATTASGGANPATTSTAGAAFMAAGDVFTTKVVGYTSGGAITPNFGNESSAPSISFVNASNVTGNIYSLVAPTANSPSNGSLTTGLSANGNGGGFNGTVTVTGNSWSEVGAFTLKPAITSYLGAGAVAGTVSGTIGRFRPYQYAVSGTLSVCSSPTFAYAGQPLKGTLTLTAQNMSGGTTTNYGKGASSLATLTAAGLPTQLTFGGLSAGLAVDTASSLYSLSFVAGQDFNTLANGTAQVAAAIPVKMSVVPSAPITSALALTGTTDEVARLPGNTPVQLLAAPTTTAFRLGRLRVLNTYGSDLLAMRVPVQAEYYDLIAGTPVWRRNTNDTCTTFATSAVALGNRNPSGLASSVTSVSAMSASSPGVAYILLAKPAAAGALDLALDLGTSTGLLSAGSACLGAWSNAPNSSTGAAQPYLEGSWCSGGNYNQMPAARLRFGVSKAPYIYLRERY